MVYRGQHILPKQQQHARIAGRVAGSRGRTEVSISGKRKLDVKKGNIATEVERSSDPKRIGRQGYEGSHLFLLRPQR